MADSKVYRQSLVINEIVAKKRCLAQFDVDIENTNRKIDVLEADIEYLSFIREFPVVFKKRWLMEESDAADMRKPLIVRADILRGHVHALNEQKQRYIMLNFPEQMSVEQWFSTLNVNSTEQMRNIINQCVENMRDAIQKAQECFERHKFKTYMDHLVMVYTVNDTRRRFIMEQYKREINEKWEQEMDKLTKNPSEKKKLDNFLSKQKNLMK